MAVDEKCWRRALADDATEIDSIVTIGHRVTRQARHNAKTRKTRREAGLCRDCGAPSKSLRCPACKAKENERRRRSRHLS